MTFPAAPVPIDQLLAHREWVRRVARAMVRDENDADDLEQGLWLEILQRPPRSGRSVRGWLFTALRRDRTDARRSEQCRAAREESHARAEAIPSAEEIVAKADAHKRVVNAVMDLAEPYRSAILYRFFEDLPPSAIAERQRVPVETVKTHLQRALALLRERFDAESGGDRNAWRLALAPMVGSGWTVAGAGAAVATGGVAMKTSTAVALASVAALLAAAALWSTTRRGDPPQRADVAAAPAPREESASPRKPERSPRPRAPFAQELDAAAPATAPAAAPAQAKPPTVPATPPAAIPPGELRGKVLAPGGRPVEGVKVRLVGGGGGPDVPRLSSSAADGSFTVTGLPEGGHLFEATFPGFGPRKFWVVIPKSGPGASVDVLFGTGGSIAGRVTVGGQAVAGATIQEGDLAQRSCETDANGEYRLDDVAPGSRRIELVARAGLPRRVQSVDVRAGETSRVDFTGDASVFGEVCFNGVPLAHATVRLKCSSVSPFRSVADETDGRGQYRIAAVSPGEWRVVVQGFEPELTTYWLVQAPDATVVAGENRIDVRIGEGDLSEELAGRVFAKSSGAPLNADQADVDLFVLEEKAPGAWAVGRNAGAAPLSRKGTFRMPGLRAGRYRLVVRNTQALPDHPALATAEIDVELLRGRGRTEVEVVLVEAPPPRERGPSVAWLSGVLKDREGRPVGNASVMARSTADQRLRQGIADDVGRFTIERLEPGAWILTVLLAGEGGYSIEIAETTVALGANEIALTLGGEGTGEIHGRVFARSTGKGLSFPGVQLTLQRIDAGGKPRYVGSAFAGQDGCFSFRSVQAGRVRIIASSQAPSFRSQTVDVDVPAGGTVKDVELSMEPISTRTGTVVFVLCDAEHRPVAATTLQDVFGGRLSQHELASRTGVFEQTFELGGHALRFETAKGALVAEVKVLVREGDPQRVEVVLRPRQ